MALCTLADTKTLLQISSSDTSHDAILNLLILVVSQQVESYCNRIFGATNYTDNLPPSMNQNLQLLDFPINSVTSITQQGNALTVDVDYFLYPQFTAAGQIYKPTGWYGPLATRGLTFDPFAPLVNIVAVYNAGWVLPGGSPVTGASNLPYDVQFATMQMVAKAYGLSNVQNLGESLVAFNEGNEGFQLARNTEMAADLFSLTSGLPAGFASLLNPYRRYAVA